MLSPAGRVERRYPYSRRGGYTFDGASNTLFFVTPRGRLATLRESRCASVAALDSGASVSADGGHFAFRLSDARPGARTANAVLFLLKPGARRAKPIYRHRLGRLGCAVGATMRWRGRHLLYASAAGQLAIIDAASGRRRGLARLEQPIVAWASDYRNR